LVSPFGRCSCLLPWDLEFNLVEEVGSSDREIEDQNSAMNTTKLAVEAKRFCGPIICVTFAWLFIRWTGAIIAAARQWPWIEDPAPGPIPSQVYVVAVLLGISFGIAPLCMLGSLAYLGWQWFRTPQAQN
jgi:hypothetical protein